jgi:adenylate kinase
MIIVLMGIQGCGKGTQAKLIAQHYSWLHLNIGGLFRNQINQKTEIGNEIKQYIDKGHLVPDEIVIDTIEKTLGLKKKGFVFDGFPRTINQAEYLVQRHEVDLVIYLDLEDEIAKQRMDSRRICSHCNRDYNILSKPPTEEGHCDSCHRDLVRREDDSLEAIEQRIKLFHDQTRPLFDFFEERHSLKIINANQSIEEVNKQIIEAIDKIYHEKTNTSI